MYISTNKITFESNASSPAKSDWEGIQGRWGGYSSPCTDLSNRDKNLDEYDADGNLINFGPLMEPYRMISRSDGGHSCWEVSTTSESPDNTYGFAARIFRAKG